MKSQREERIGCDVELIYQSIFVKTSNTGITENNEPDLRQNLCQILFIPLKTFPPVVRLPACLKTE